ncbi:hypothetical protein WR164_10080 [Philodulcilactobacillus myokoensis]|uniref:DUF3397 domain-containing protein n=1 Tax=Philodulcilactobacillus myokoensis TaxID=2929573 RepID=A0A9W6B123_9LACO|nr:hypothetical protein WR164_10080 [Philodulcilactobacillus myokoensis]
MFHFFNLLLAVCIQIIIIIILSILKKIISKKSKFIYSIRLMDLLPPFLLYFIYRLTLNVHGYSIMPYIVIVWMLIGIGLTIYEGYFQKDINLKLFYKIFWRIGDILLSVSWLFSIIWAMVTKI